MLNKFILIVALVTANAVFAGQAPQAPKPPPPPGQDGRGGHEIRNAFRLRAAELLLMVEMTPEAGDICAPDIMKAGYDAHQVKVVGQLMDLRRSVPIANEKLQAWTQNNVIQLLETPWQKRLIDDATAKKSEPQELTTNDALIFHEIFRTTGQQCPDEKEERSTALVQLLRQKKGVHAKWFTFYFVSPEEQEKLKNERNLHLQAAFDKIALCTSDYEYCLKKRGANSCQPNAGVSAYLTLLKMKVGDPLPENFKVSNPDTWIKKTYEQVAHSPPETIPCANGFIFAISSYISSVGAFATSQTKFHLVMDLQTGHWFYGIDPRRLRELKF